jgi:hypothetical protein
MNVKNSLSIGLLGVFLAASPLTADEHGSRQDSEALDVLKRMNAYTASLDRFSIDGGRQDDARMDAGLMVSNSTEVAISADRPGSLQISSFDGEERKELYFHEGKLTVYGSKHKYYAQADIPEEIEAALEFALEELEVEAPLMDLIYRDSSRRMITDRETVIYLQNKARVEGVDCHHIAIRGSELDVQLWVEEGDRPVPRRIMITSKWEGGSPRFTATLKWDSEPDFKQNVFEFIPPEGAMNVGFAQRKRSEGE